MHRSATAEPGPELWCAAYGFLVIGQQPYWNEAAAQLTSYYPRYDISPADRLWIGRAVDREFSMKVLLVQLDTAARSNLRAIVRDLSDDLDVLEADDAAATAFHLRTHPDLDLLVADLHAARSVELLRNKDDALPNPAARLVVWSCSPCYLELVSAAVLGAMAYLPNTAPRSVTRAALQIVLAGGRYFPPDLLVAPQSNDWESHASVWSALTPRQAEVLTLMAAGRSNKGIARELGMSAGTVKVHVTAILKALDVRNRTEAVVAVQRGRSPRQLYEPPRRMMSGR